MKKFILPGSFLALAVPLLFSLIMAACTPAPVIPQATQTPTAIINQDPTMMPTPTLAVQMRPIGEDQKVEAENFFYELKNRMAIGEYEHFAEEVRYPITVKVDGQPKTFVYAAEFEHYMDKIFSRDEINKFISTDESELIFTSSGVQVGDGPVWFNWVCMDPDCEEAEFLITEINN